MCGNGWAVVGLNMTDAVVALRPLEPGDLSELQSLADDRSVSINLRDVFPYPYTAADAEWWLDFCGKQVISPGLLRIFPPLAPLRHCVTSPVC